MKNFENYFKKEKWMNPVRNSSRSTQRLSTGGASKPALRDGTPYGAEPGIVLKSNPRCSRRPRLRPRGAAAPEGGPLARREQRAFAAPKGLPPRSRGILSNGGKGLL